MEQTARITGGLRQGLAAWTRWGWLLGVGFLLITLVSRIPFRSQTLFAWDSANYAFALEEYNVAFHQPQPPGYPLYVASARLFYALGFDANTSYVALSLIASSLAVWCLYLLGWRLYDLQTAVVSALLLATSSNFWSHGEVAYPYAFLALFSTLMLLLLTETKLGTRNLIVPAAFVLGLGAGFRPDLLLFLLPVWVYAWWGRSLRSLAAGFGVLLVVVLAWAIPTVQLSGGWEAYLRASTEHYGFWAGQSSGLIGYLKSVLDNTRTLVTVLYNGVGLALLPIVYFLGRYFSPQQVVRDARTRLILLWIAVPFVFYMVVFMGNPGYVLSFLPGLIIYAALAVRGFARDCEQACRFLMTQRGMVTTAITPHRVSLGITFVLVAVITVSNSLLFFFAPGAGRYQEIRQIDETLTRQVRYITLNHSPDNTLIIAFDRSHQLEYYLQDYSFHLLFNPGDPRYWESRREFTSPAGITQVLLPDLGRNTSDRTEQIVEIGLGPGVSLFVAHVKPGDTLIHGHQYASVRPPPEEGA
ncbi:MAG: glycosyltransferase family 39 protein [Chloroflexota bacterium]|nr:glycosyltransferase family 39 protein [Chloroflexota bacterium]MDE2840368.1 glycosyltransferase family 39 protein [Chloroflexota bacterium]